MATLTTDLLPQLNIELRDADNFTWTVAEKTEALRKSIEDDSSVFVIDQDESNILVANDYTYDSPFTTTIQVGYDAYSDGSFEPISRGSWEDINGTIYLDRSLSLPAGKKLYLRGVSPLTSGANISSPLRSYIIANAVIASVDMLMQSKINRFNRNDSTMAEMQMVRSNNMAKVARLRGRLRNKRTVRF